MSTADELIKLKSLLDEGVLTEDEFESAKAKVLASTGSLDSPHTRQTRGPGFGIAGMVLGIIGLLGGFAIQRSEATRDSDLSLRDQAYVAMFFAFLGIVFGGVGCGGKRRGRGMAIAGLACGLLGMALAIVFLSK